MEKLVFIGRKGDNHRYHSSSKNIEIDHAELNLDNSETLYMKCDEPFSVTYLDSDGIEHEIKSSQDAW